MSVSDDDTASFQALRPRLFGIAQRVLGSATEAEDVVQDAWLRWQGTDRGEVRDAAAFLATTTTRLAMNVTASARARRETRIDPRFPDPVDPGPDPAATAERRDALQRALCMLLERMTPAERAAYLLREAFGGRYRRIAEALQLSEANARQLVARARGRLGDTPRRQVHAVELRQLLEGFLAASEAGDLAALERVLLADITRGRAGDPLASAA